MKTGIFDKKKIIPALVVFFFFGAYILLGYSIYKDYGVSTDEPVDYLRGQIDFKRFSGGSLEQFEKDCSMMGDETICYYPSLFSMLLYRIAPYGDNQPVMMRGSSWYGPGGNTQSIYFHRHQVIFAFFAFSVFIFFLIGKKIFKDWKIGLLGALFLIISPRIFAQSFYNPKDIPFLSAYVISIYTLLLFLEKKNVFTAILHGFAIGVVCCIRTPGLIIIPITLFIFLFDLFLSKEKWQSYLKAGLFLFISLIIAAGLVYWFTPILYTNPIANYIKAFNIMKQYPWNNYQLYMGQNIMGKVPWHYSLVWFAISSPVFYLFLFLLGSVILIARTIKSRTREHFLALRDLYLVGACGVLPIIIVILLKSTLYNGDRQMYFVYPALLLVSLYGFKVIIDKIRQKTLRWQWVTAIILVAGLAYPVYFMVRYHPFQYVYFNFLAGPRMSDIKENFSLDYWGISVRNGLEYIAGIDPAQKINVQIVGNFSEGWLVLPKQDRQRLNITASQPPDYIIDTYRRYPIEKVTQGKVIYSIRVGDTDILTVYKR
ncbi:MAG: glycosyltransferase family 39 protein [Anaerolineaceae bacterium]|jgi:hypothetical protein